MCLLIKIHNNTLRSILAKTIEHRIKLLVLITDLHKIQRTEEYVKQYGEDTVSKIWTVGNFGTTTLQFLQQRKCKKNKIKRNLGDLQTNALFG